MESQMSAKQSCEKPSDSTERGNLTNNSRFRGCFARNTSDIKVVTCLFACRPDYDDDSILSGNMDTLELAVTQFITIHHGVRHESSRSVRN
ncbi:hypothetical protein PRIPAC_78280, partial [Pristionchus pacificus]|uniref:Uncharacterized protein n=1 Tax=Pristionchus pacificus TaxID=54126 RepID=A0A2A6BWI9_PRIPA